MAGPGVGATSQELGQPTMPTSDDPRVVRQTKCIGVDARPPGANIDLAPMNGAFHIGSIRFVSRYSAKITL
jgi:hypothetical protein